jgi:hypothetical protein
MKKQKRTVLLHLLAWLAFSTYLVLSSYPHYKANYSLGFILYKQFLYTFVFVIPFYINYRWVVPRCFIHAHRPWQFVFSLLGLVVLDFILNLGHGYLLEMYLPGSGNIEERLANWGYVFTPLLFLGVSSGLRLSAAYYQEQEEKVALRQQVADAEMALLKSQINPHFLFNCLNNIYALAQKQSPHTADALLKLSEIMRYVLHEASAKEVSLKQEVMFIRHFISLQRLRLQEGVEVVEDIEVAKDDRLLPPLLLIPFVENAFKHSDLIHQQRPIEIKLHADANALQFEVRNKLGSLIKEHSSGIGLQNLQQRLSRLMPGNYEMTTREAGGTYHAHLTLRFG